MASDVCEVKLDNLMVPYDLNHLPCSGSYCLKVCKQTVKMLL